MIELVVASIVAISVLGVALGLINQQRRQFLTDQTRSDANQNLRLGMEFIGTDIQEAGERVGSNQDLPVISLIDGGSDPDELVRQRKLIQTSLSVCNGFGSTDKTITVASHSDSSADCEFSDARSDTTTDPDAKTDALNDFRDYRCSQDGTTTCDRATPADTTNDCDEECILAYVHDPSIDSGAGGGEFFLYTYEDCVDDVDDDWVGDGPDEDDDVECNNHIADNPNQKILNRIHAIPLGDDGYINTGTPTDDAVKWKNTYTDQATVYILEERSYKLVAENSDDCDDPDAEKTVLAVVVNRQEHCDPENLPNNDTLTLEPLRLVNNLSDLEITIKMESGSEKTSFNETLTYSDPDGWKEIKYIEVDLEALMVADSDVILNDVNKNIDEDENGEKKRHLSTRFYPRNAISQ